IAIKISYKNNDVWNKHRTNKIRHTGSTFLVRDFNGDGVKDLLLGDADYSEIAYMINTNTTFEANFNKQEDFFPSKAESVSMYSMPAFFEVDVDLDGRKDLLISPFDPSPDVSHDYQCVWYYRNIGSEQLPSYKLITKSFLQDDMIDVGTSSHPVVYDWNGDGLDDLFIGNWGQYHHSYYEHSYFLKSEYYASISYYQNVGSKEEPRFELMNHDFASLYNKKLKGVFPAFFDLNNDGKKDLVYGCADGTLHGVIFDMKSGKQIHIDKPLWEVNVGKFAAPFFFDINGDGMDDLFVGNKKGRIYAYRNIGGEQPMQKVTDLFGSIDVTNTDKTIYGYASPCLFRLPANQNKIYIMVGSETGELKCFEVDPLLWTKAFDEIKNLDEMIPGFSMDFNYGDFISPCIFKGSKQLNVLVGNQCGGIHWAGQGENPKAWKAVEEVKQQAIDFNLYPNPCSRIIKLDVSDPTKAYSYAIYSLSGLKVKEQQELSASEEIDLSELQKGVYVFKLYCRNACNLQGIRKIVLR
ncbi:MAG: T9SS type A sorting domain-containing protein, partial [Bacteroidales bacterium]